MSQQKTIQLRKQVSPFEKSETWMSVRQVINTIVPFFILWVLAYKALSISIWVSLPISLLASGFLIRTFIIFHDCCHHSFFKNRTANKVLGTITGIMTMFPYSQWAWSHSVHHATSGNLDKRGVGDIWVLTVEEYMQASAWVKLQYRLYRNPLVMFGLGPIFLLLVSNRFNRKEARLKERLNLYLTNASIAGIAAILCLTIGWKEFLLVHGLIAYLSGMAGIWLFYVQHTFEDSYYEHNEEWDYVLAAVEGSSFYKLPKILQFLTGNIGFHHVHHLSPRVPNYNLEAAHNNTDPLKHVPTVTLATSLTSLRFRLWDEETKQFVGYKHVKDLAKVRDIPMTTSSK